MPASSTQPPQGVDAFALMAMQRQQAEAAFQQAWQNLTVLEEMSRQAEKKKEAQDSQSQEASVAAAVAAAKAAAASLKKEEENKSQVDSPPQPDAKDAEPVEEAKTEGKAIGQDAEDKAKVAPQKIQRVDENGQPVEMKPGRVLLHIKRVGQFDTGDGLLEIFARYTSHADKKAEQADGQKKRDDEPPREDARAKSAADAPPAESSEPSYAMPRPKKMPVPKPEVREPAYPPCPAGT